MPTRESAAQRGARLARRRLVRIGEELRIARVAAGLSSRHVGDSIGVSHTQILRIERALAPHVDIGVLARFAAAVGHDLAMSIHPAGPPVRDAGHLRLLGRLRERLPPGLQWRTEVPMPIHGDPRSADATIRGPNVDVMVEAETHLGDLQAVERRIAAKQRDLGARRVILLLADTRHHRVLVRSVPWLTARFPIGTRQVLIALARGEDPGGDGLVVL